MLEKRHFNVETFNDTFLNEQYSNCHNLDNELFGKLVNSRLSSTNSNSNGDYFIHKFYQNENEYISDNSLHGLLVSFKAKMIDISVLNGNNESLLHIMSKPIYRYAVTCIKIFIKNTQYYNVNNQTILYKITHSNRWTMNMVVARHCQC